MKTFSFKVLLAFLYVSAVSAQYAPNDELLTIGNRKITAGEFERIFNKNYNVNATEKQSVAEYFNLFLKFELKVSAALDSGLDTLASFKTELKGYRDQLAKSYLTDNDAIDRLIQEAYDRTVNEVNVSHIMVKLTEHPTSADTAKAYKKIMDIRNRIKGGESFEKLAVELSDDPSAKQNKGKIGYFSAFRIVYPFECAAYNTKVGEISMPVRTKFGYHLIRVNDKRLSRGEVKVAHIMVAVPQRSSDSVWQVAKSKIDSLYEKLQRGEDFKQLASKYSDDTNSGVNGGELPWFGSGRMVPEFEEAAFVLKTPGEISKPIKTDFGWHILKFIDKRDVPSFDQIKNDLKTKVNQSDRSESINRSFVEKLKKEYPHKLDAKNLSAFYKLDSTIYKGKINLPGNILALPLLTIEQKEFSGSDFKKYLQSNPIAENYPVKDYIDQSFKIFTDNSFIQYHDEHLTKKYPEFDNLIKEYHDGILLFDIMDRQVWSKASRDSAGLVTYYNQLTDKPSWGERLDASIFTCKTKGIVENAEKFISGQQNHEFTNDQLVKMVCDSVMGYDCIKIERLMLSKGDNQFIDSIAWKTGLTRSLTINNQIVFAYVWNILKPEVKKLEEIRGLITADYQNYLEEKWIEELKNKYKVVINNKLLNKIADKYKNIK
jgi:peptidyl-prolyl cis-trans isomerase SurA